MRLRFMWDRVAEDVEGTDVVGPNEIVFGIRKAVIFERSGKPKHAGGRRSLHDVSCVRETEKKSRRRRKKIDEDESGLGQSRDF
ncbi:hypothetical protein Q31b_19230 [Novipirellula aureliae]|uniref:Uncharacterized protein n=1 Tax=Novipirellula aureliae TaxID=2527966 RepID=A0A5C6E924_9BACT|nr:hypothetical protein Q31b_19230 [Novipirellula aureliae]